MLRGRLIALRADFFSFGTNDLTQTAIGFSRDDVGGAMLKRYMQEKIVERSPFGDDRDAGVGWLVRLAAWVGARRSPTSSSICVGSTAATRTRSRSSNSPGSTT